MPLTTDKPTLQIEIEQALEKGFKASFIFGAGKDGDKIAKKFAETAAPDIANAIYKYVSNMSITITPSTLVSSTGPVSGVILPTDINIL